MSDQLKVILLCSAGVIGFVGTMVLVVAIAVGAFFLSRKSGPEVEVTPGGVTVSVPGSNDANWIAPILGSDPDAYRLPFRNNNQCNGPDCNR